MKVFIQYPQATQRYRVRQYGTPEMKALGYSLAVQGVPSNFAYVDVHIPGLGTSSITNHCRLSLADVAQHRALQYAQEGSTVSQIMNWFYGDGEPSGRPYWWHTATEARWGCILFSGGLVTIDRIETQYVKVPNSPDMALMEMGRIVPFMRSDFGKSIADLLAAGKIQQASAVHGDDIFNPTPRGAVMYSPIWSPVDFDVHPVNDGLVRELWAYMPTLEAV
jgi:hypothetical protein